ncbi:MAG: PAS domain S-box protein, partial [Planctomycetota bacterium]
REEARRWRRLAEDVCHGLWEVDHRGRTVWANGFLAEMLQTTPEKLRGRAVEDFVAVSQLEEWTRHWEQAQSGVAKQFDLRLVGDALLAVDVLVQATPRFDRSGVFSGAVLAVADVSERQAERRRLQHRESLYRLLFEHCPVALWELDFREVAEWFEQLRWQGITRLDEYLRRYPQAVREAAELVRMERANAAAIRLLEAERPADLPKALAAFWDGAGSDVFRMELVRLWDAERTVSVEARITTLKGRQRDVLVNMLVPSVEGMPDYARVLTAMVDVSPLKAAQRELAVKEERYRLLFDHSGMSVTVIDRDGRFLMANHYACQRLQLSPAEIAGKTLWDFFPKRDADEYLRRIRQVIETERSIQVEDCVDVLGQKCWFWSVLQPFHDPEGHRPAVQIVSHDITARKLAEQQLRENEQRLQAVVAQTPGVLWTVDRRLRVETFSGQGPSLLGDADTEIIGQPLEAVLRLGGEPASAERLVRMHREALAGNNVSVRIRRASRWYEVRLQPIRDPSERITGAIGVALDVTDKETTRRQIDLLLERLAIMLQTIQDGFARLDPELRIKETNPALARLLEVQPVESLIGRPLDAFACARCREVLRQWLQRQETGTRPPMVFEFVTSAGGRRFVELTACHTVIAGTREIAVFMRDVTERQRSQLERERLIAMLEQKNDQLERFADTVAHDFKGYLVNIEGFAERLLLDLQTGCQERAEEDRAFLIRYVEQLRAGINGLVDRARRGVTARLTDVADLCEIVRRAAESEKNVARRENVDFEVHVAGADVPVLISCDRAALLRAIENVLRNARRHAGACAKPVVHVDVHRQAGAGILIAIRDNGPGFPDELLERAFDCEVRADPQDPDGRGLGLYFVRNIIESHQGNVWIRNNRDIEGVPDEGATVFFSLPETLVHPA